MATAREQLRSRNVLRNVQTAQCCEDRGKRIKENTIMIKALQSHEQVTQYSTDVDVDFNLFKIIQDNLKSSMGSRDKGVGLSTCPNHSTKAVEYILCDEKLAICSDCLHDHMGANTKILSIEETMSRVRKLLMTIEKDSIRIIQTKNVFLREVENHGEFIEQQKEEFINEQKRKIAELHKYLDDKLSHIIVQYNERIERELLKVYNTREAMGVEIQESLRYLRKLQEVAELSLIHI